MFAVSYQLITFLGVLEIFITCLVIYITICKFSVAFADDFVANFNDISRKIGECNGNFTSIKRTILNQQLTDIMDFQINAIQLSVVIQQFIFYIVNKMRLLQIFFLFFLIFICQKTGLWHSLQNSTKNSLQWFSLWLPCIFAYFYYDFKW